MRVRREQLEAAPKYCELYTSELVVHSNDPVVMLIIIKTELGREVHDETCLVPELQSWRRPRGLHLQNRRRELLETRR
jgi:hypothetical protein